MQKETTFHVCFTVEETVTFTQGDLEKSGFETPEGYARWLYRETDRDEMNINLNGLDILSQTGTDSLQAVLAWRRATA